MLFRFYESKLWESSSINGSLSSKLQKSSDWCRTPRLRVMQSDHCPKTAISLITNLPDCIGWRQHFTRDSTEHKPSYCKHLEKAISGIKNSPRPHDAATDNRKNTNYPTQNPDTDQLCEPNGHKIVDHPLLPST